MVPSILNSDKYSFQSIFAETVLMIRSNEFASLVNVWGSEVA